METLYVPGRPKIAVDLAGSGDVLLFLHGIGGNRTNWHEQIEFFASRFRAVAIDVRGWGLSEDYEGPLDFDDVTADIVRVLAHLGAEDCHIVGLSMGGLIAQHVLWRQPRIVRSAVFADTSAGPGEEHDAQWIEEFLRLRKAPLLAGQTPADIAPAVARSLAVPNAPASSTRRLEASIAALHKESYLKALDYVSNYKRRLDHAAVSIPVHVMVGEFDQLTPLAQAQSLAARFGSCAVGVVPGAGHLSNMDNANAFNQQLDTFLTGHRSRGGSPT